jgi:hypothetical protein
MIPEMPLFSNPPKLLTWHRETSKKLIRLRRILRVKELKYKQI